MKNSKSNFSAEREQILKMLDRFDFSIPGIIKDANGKHFTCLQLSTILGKSLTQTKRIIKTYREFKSGKIESFIEHKNINNENKARLDPQIELLLIQEYDEFIKYTQTYISKKEKFCIQSFATYFNNKYPNLLSGSSIYKYLKQNKIISDFANNKTKKQFKQLNPRAKDLQKSKKSFFKILNDLNNDEISLFLSEWIASKNEDNRTKIKGILEVLLLD